MNELLSSWTLTWFVALNIISLSLSVVYYLFEIAQKRGQ